MSASTKKDKFIEKIIINLEKVNVKDWKSYTLPETEPMNLFTKIPYNGYNVLSLYLHTIANNYSSNYYASFNAISKAGGQIKKGSKGAIIKFYKLCYKHIETSKIINSSTYDSLSDSEQENYEKYLTIKHYTLFNSDCISNLEELDIDLTYVIDEEKAFQESQLCEKFVSDLIIKGDLDLRLEQDGLTAFYNFKDDFVSMPRKKLFADSNRYYTILFHELIHWTGTRLGRTMQSFRQDKDKYSDEELIAEMGAMLLSLQFGIKEHIINSIIYLKSWLLNCEKDQQYLKLENSFKESKKGKKYIETLIK